MASAIRGIVVQTINLSQGDSRVSAPVIAPGHAFVGPVRGVHRMGRPHRGVTASVVHHHIVHRFLACVGMGIGMNGNLAIVVRGVVAEPVVPATDVGSRLSCPVQDTGDIGNTIIIQVSREQVGGMECREGLDIAKAVFSHPGVLVILLNEGFNLISRIFFQVAYAGSKGPGGAGTVQVDDLPFTIGGLLIIETMIRHSATGSREGSVESSCRGAYPSRGLGDHYSCRDLFGSEGFNAA